MVVVNIDRCAEAALANRACNIEVCVGHATRYVDAGAVRVGDVRVREGERAHAADDVDAGCASVHNADVAHGRTIGPIEPDAGSACLGDPCLVNEDITDVRAHDAMVPRQIGTLA